MKPSEILREALVLLRDGDAWTRDSMARDQHELPTSVLDNSACKYCMVGAVMRVARTHEQATAEQCVWDYMRIAANAPISDSIVRLAVINDKAMSFDTVATILRNAATLAERAGQ